MTEMATRDAEGNPRPGIWLGESVPTAEGSPNASATGIFVHCGFSPTDAGSRGCLTISPEDCEDFFGNFSQGESVNVTIE